MLEASLRRLEAGEPPLLGLRWVPSEVKLLRRTPQLHTPPSRRHHSQATAAGAQGGDTASVAALKAALRRQDEQIRWLRQLAMDAPGPLPKAGAMAQRRRALFWHWARRTYRRRAVGHRATAQALQAAAHTQNTRVAELENQRSALVMAVDALEGSLGDSLGRLAVRWSASRALSTWRRYRHGGTRGAALAWGRRQLLRWAWQRLPRRWYAWSAATAVAATLGRQLSRLRALCTALAAWKGLVPMVRGVAGKAPSERRRLATALRCLDAHARRRSRRSRAQAEASVVALEEALKAREASTAALSVSAEVVAQREAVESWRRRAHDALAGLEGMLWPGAADGTVTALKAAVDHVDGGSSSSLPSAAGFVVMALRAQLAGERAAAARLVRALAGSRPDSGPGVGPVRAPGPAPLARLRDAGARGDATSERLAWTRCLESRAAQRRTLRTRRDAGVAEALMFQGRLSLALQGRDSR